MRIIFLGTPEFAVPSLAALLQAGHEIVAVVTAPDSLGGRGGKQMIQSDIKKYAVVHNLNILQPLKLRDPDFILQLKELQADLQVVVAFRMLPRIVWDMPPLGTINVHGSLLPKYRGAAPIHWAVIRGETITGVTVFRLKHEIDTGDIICQSSLEIGSEETTGEVYYKLMHLGADALVRSLHLLQQGHLTYIKQDDTLACPAPKLFHENCKIDINQPATVIHNFIRGLSPKPTAWTRYQDLKYFFYRSKRTDLRSTHNPGSLFIYKNQLYLSTQDYDLEITEIQVEGKKIMTEQEFVNGNKANAGFK